MLKRQGFYTLGKLILYGFSFCNSVVVLTDESTLENSLKSVQLFSSLYWSSCHVHRFWQKQLFF